MTITTAMISNIVTLTIVRLLLIITIITTISTVLGGGLNFEGSGQCFPRFGLRLGALKKQ